jgi:lambda repressor-like predicted transcriptional regulator
MSTARANNHNGAAPEGLSLAEAAERVGVAPSTLRRWARQGLLPRYDGSWSPAVISHAKIVARLRERGHSLEDIRAAGAEVLVTSPSSSSPGPTSSSSGSRTFG